MALPQTIVALGNPWRVRACRESSQNAYSRQYATAHIDPGIRNSVLKT